MCISGRNLRPEDVQVDSGSLPLTAPKGQLTPRYYFSPPGRLLHISYSTTALVYFRRTGKVIFQRRLDYVQDNGRYLMESRRRAGKYVLCLRGAGWVSGAVGIVKMNEQEEARRTVLCYSCFMEQHSF